MSHPMFLGGGAVHENHPKDKILSPKSLFLAALAHVKIWGVYVGKKSDVTSIQQPTTTISTTADHGQSQRKWPPSAAHEALRPESLCSMGEDPPQAAGVNDSQKGDTFLSINSGRKTDWEKHLEEE